MNLRFKVDFFNIVIGLLFISSLTFFTVGLIIDDLTILAISTFFQFLFNISFCCKKFTERAVFFAFNITYFTFLSSRPIVDIVFDYYDFYNQNGLLGFSFTDPLVVKNILIALFFGLFMAFCGYYYMEKRQGNFNIELKSVFGLSIDSIQIVSKYVFYFSFLFLVLIILEKNKFTANNSYAELYSNYKSSYPSIFVKISEMNYISLFIFLSTLPTKRKSFIPLSLFFLSGVLYLFVGQRNNFVLNILLILVYLCFRNITDKNRVIWFGKKEVITCLLSFPIIISLLNFISYSRMNMSIVKESSFIDKIAEFFYSQSVSSNLIGFSQTLSFPENKIYSLGRLTDFLQDNFISQLLFNTDSYPSQTMESALYGNSFADTVSYAISPKRYLNGWGYGSSYIAEFMKDGGLILVVIGSIIMGVILFKVYKLFFKNPIYGGLSLSMIRLLLYAPRDTFLSFLVTTFSIINMLTICLILCIAFILDANKKKSVFQMSDRI